MVISLFILLVLQAYLSITSSAVAERANSVNTRCLGRLLMTSVVLEVVGGWRMAGAGAEDCGDGHLLSCPCLCLFLVVIVVSGIAWRSRRKRLGPVLALA